jgi:uncharacterized protein (TIGR02302 family)
MNEASPSLPPLRAVTLERLAMVWERVWGLLHWPLVVAALGLALTYSGLLAGLSGLTRGVVLTFAGALFLFSCRALLKLRIPSSLEAMRRLEARAMLQHRPLSSSGDSLAAEFLDPRADAIWEEAQRRKFAALDGIAARMPRSPWRVFDPLALKVPAGLVLLASLLLGSGHVSDIYRAAPSPAAAALAAKALEFDVWLKPPAYTGRPPLLLTSPALLDRLAKGETLDTPQNSQVTVRISGAQAPSLSFRDLAGATLAKPPVPQTHKPDAETLAADFTVDRDMVVVLRDHDKDLATFPLRMIADQVPFIQFAKPPHGESRGALVTDWKVSDDYGVTAITGDMQLADEQEGGVGFESNGIFLFDPPKLTFALRHPNAREEAGSSTHDLAAHPWAGLNVTLTLSAKDGARQEGKSETLTFKLPEREFIRPMAQALIEQRKQLILYPERSQDIGAMLDTLVLYPDGQIERSGQVAAIAMLASRLRNVTGYDDVKEAVGGLWKIAVDIEEGSAGDAKQELQALKKELEKALAEGASPERLQQLMDKMRKAMDRYMDELQKQAERQMKDGTLKRPAPGQGGKSVSREQLKKMLDELEKMAKGGSKEAAQQMLDQLDRLLQNMRPGSGENQQADGEMSKMMDELGKMMREQQKLMDETQRQPGPGQPGGQGDSQQGQQGEQGQQGKGMDGLADRQQSLKDMLDKMLGQNGQGSPGDMPSELGDANEAMKNAEQGLRSGDKDGALKDEGAALDSLRKGAGKLAQQLRRNSRGEAEDQAQDGDGKGGDDDPLGRPRATHAPDTGPDKNILPTEQAMERAREILKTLRARANEGGLTDGERGYIDRLLRGLY